MLHLGRATRSSGFETIATPSVFAKPTGGRWRRERDGPFVPGDWVPSAAVCTVIAGVVRSRERTSGPSAVPAHGLCVMADTFPAAEADGALTLRS